ncbi:hypothetical protein [Spirillospora sp. NPDC029432]|uniref:hypothetical protein n=1 Tax=Spirillospora sp. NPDC029432 TaxID=3154599 RepID=UPI003454889C
MAIGAHAVPCADERVAEGKAIDHGPITHVLLRVGDWASRPRRLRVDGPAGTRVARPS